MMIQYAIWWYIMIHDESWLYMMIHPINKSYGYPMTTPRRAFNETMATLFETDNMWGTVPSTPPSPTPSIIIRSSAQLLKSMWLFQQYWTHISHHCRLTCVSCSFQSDDEPSGRTSLSRNVQSNLSPGEIRLSLEAARPMCEGAFTAWWKARAVWPKDIRRPIATLVVECAPFSCSKSIGCERVNKFHTY